MNISAIYKAGIMSVPLIAFAQSEQQNRQSFMSLSDHLFMSWAKHTKWGKTAKKNFAASLLPKPQVYIKYMNELEVQQTMNNYELGRVALNMPPV